MIIAASIIAYMIINLVSWVSCAYLDNRYLITEEVIDDNAYELEHIGHVILCSIGIGICMGIVVLFSFFKRKLKFKKYSFMTGVAKAGKKHGEQDRDLTYQAEKALLDNK